MSDPFQPVVGAVNTTSSVQDVIEHMRLDFAQTGAFKPSDLKLVLGDIRTSVIVAAVGPDFGATEPGKPGPR